MLFLFCKLQHSDANNIAQGSFGGHPGPGRGCTSSCRVLSNLMLSAFNSIMQLDQPLPGMLANVCVHIQQDFHEGSTACTYACASWCTQEKGYSGDNSYALSKLASMMFTTELADVMKAQGVTVNCLDPGTVNTKLLIAGWGACGIDIKVQH